MSNMVLRDASASKNTLYLKYNCWHLVIRVEEGVYERKSLLGHPGVVEQGVLEKSLKGALF